MDWSVLFVDGYIHDSGASCMLNRATALIDVSKKYVEELEKGMCDMYNWQYCSEGWDSIKIARHQPKPASWFGNGNKNGLVTHTIA